LHKNFSMDTFIVKDSNGNILQDGDTVSVIKSLKVKGSTTTIKQGTTIKKIRLTDDPEEVDCKVDGMSVVLKTCFLKKK
jgi:protein PhnA